MSSTLHIDGLLTSVSHQELTGMFSKFGNVQSVNIYKAEKASSFDVGTVEMASMGEASKAIQALHRSYLGGKLLRVPRSSRWKGLTARDVFTIRLFQQRGPSEDCGRTTKSNPMRNTTCLPAISARLRIFVNSESLSGRTHRNALSCISNVSKGTNGTLRSTSRIIGQVVVMS